MADQLKDGTTLPKPLRHEVHREGFYKASMGEHIEYVVVEAEFPTFLTLSMTCNHEDFRFGAVEYLGQIVALRIEQGWTLMSLTDSGASLRRA